MENHVFEASAVWEGNSDSVGTVTTPGGLHTTCAVPAEFKGPGGHCSPEELMLAALASCYIITIAFMCEIKKLPLLKQTMRLEGEVGRDPESKKTRFLHIFIEIQMTVAPDATDTQKEAILQAAKDAKSRCFVSNSLRDDVHIDVDAEIV